MDLFNQVVDGIAEVSRIQYRAPSPSECRIDSPIYVTGLVGDIVREPGVCYSTFSLTLIADFVATHVLVNQQIRDDRVIRNPTTDQCIGGPFRGHTNGVNSVAYSHDSSHIVSGSWGNAITVLGLTTDQCTAGPLQGHKANDLSTRAWTPPPARHDFYLPIHITSST